MLKLLVYVLSLICSIFAVSGINFEHIIKRNHVSEARFLFCIISFALTYLLANFILDLMAIEIIN